MSLALPRPLHGATPCVLLVQHGVWQPAATSAAEQPLPVWVRRYRPVVTSRRALRFRRDENGYETWVAVTDTPLLIRAVAFVAVLALPYAVDLDRAGHIAVTAANVVMWAVFATDYCVRFYLASDRRQYVRSNVLDLVIVFLPFLRPLRALRLLRLLRLGAVGGVLYRRSGSFHARVSAYVGTTALVVVGLAALAMFDAERDAPSANIKSLPDALWWAATTVTTVGYGDRYPTTTTGRFIAIVLMVVGIALLGVITASIAAWFVQRLKPLEEAEDRADSTLVEVLAELRRMNERLDAMEAQARASTVSTGGSS
jgi:voltage-gated potassium channel